MPTSKRSYDTNPHNDDHNESDKATAQKCDGQEGSDLTELDTECDDEQNCEEELVIVDGAD